ncbi:MAG: FTR1 family protein, partial [Bdellovibrionaceae bacterium]|nr:FTR1 family protein [Pseudobdellovibrionaceae bacterium]
CLAVGREGSETVLFLYGMANESMAKGHLQPLVTAIVLGLSASVVTWFIFNQGLKFFKQQVFFKITTVLLFLTASSLTIKLTQKFIELEVISPLKVNIWDTSAILDENSGLGRVVSGLTGYHSSPSLMTVIVYVLYWVITGYLYYRPKKSV